MEMTFSDIGSNLSSLCPMAILMELAVSQNEFLVHWP